MLSPSRIKQLKALHRKKYRKQDKRILLEGVRLIDQAIQGNARFDEVWLTKKLKTTTKGKILIEQAEINKIPVSITTEKIIRQISDSLNNQGIIALAKIPEYQSFQSLPKQSIYLDSISDPGNMGTILRTAAWFGVTSIFLSKECVDPFNSKVVRAALGAHFYFKHLNFVEDDSLFEGVKGVTIFGTGLKGNKIGSLSTDEKNDWVLVLGNEARGLSDSVKKYISKTISIPGKEGMESLNVAVANGIILQGLTTP